MLFSGQFYDIAGINLICVKVEGKRFLHGDLICTYTLSEYVSDIYVYGLCIISVKKLKL